MFAAIGVLAFLKPIVTESVKGHVASFAAFATAHKIAFGIFCANFINLIYLGSSPAAAPYVISSKASTGIYFGYFLIVLPLLAFLNKEVLAEAEKMEVKAEVTKLVVTKIIISAPAVTIPAGAAVVTPLTSEFRVPATEVTHPLIPLLVANGDSSGASTK